MTRPTLLLLPAILVTLTQAFALGQDNPVLDQLLSKQVKQELSKMNSPETGYRDGAHWLHLDNPEKNLSVHVTMKQTGETGQLNGSAEGKVAFNYQVEDVKHILGRRVVLFRENFGGYANVKLTLTASAKLGKQLSDSQVTITEIRVDQLRMRSDAAKPFQGRIQDWVNKELQARKPDFAKKLAAALNTVKP